MFVRSNDGWERRMSMETRMDVSDRKLRGTAIVFNAASLDLGGFTEYIAPEAVDRTLREGLDVRALIDHDTSKIIGRTKSGTLSLRKTRKGLEIEVDPPGTSYARDLMESVERGDISGMSFGCRVLDDNWEMRDGQPVRTVLDMVISEVSAVSMPAYVQTDVMVAQRSLAQFREDTKGRSLEMARRWHKSRIAR